MKRETFADLEDPEFTVRSENGSEIKLKLIEVSELKTTKSHEEFSLVFLAPADTVPNPVMTKLSHSSLGEVELFLSPFSSDENGLKLEAAFCLEV